MTNSEEKLREHLNRLYAEIHDETAEGFADKQHDFVFHLLEAASELKTMSSLLTEPERYSTKEAKEIVRAFLYHAAGHIVAAARLYDVFIDSFQESEPEDEQTGGSGTNAR